MIGRHLAVVLILAMQYRLAVWAVPTNDLAAVFALGFTQCVGPPSPISPLASPTRWTIGCAPTTCTCTLTPDRITAISYSAVGFPMYIPAEIEFLDALTSLQLTNSVTGTLPEYLGKLTNMIILNFNADVTISGTFPSDIAGLSKLQPSNS